jgi:hypothetical protein
MSKQPTAKNLRAVERAIALRATGHTWDQVRKLLRLALRTVRGYPREYPEFWAKRLAQAHRELDEEVLGEARSVLRFHMRSDEKDGRNCARILLDHARRRLGLPVDPAAEPADQSPYHQIADYLEGLSDEERQHLLDAEPGPGGGVEIDASLLPPGLRPITDGCQ